MQLPKFKTVHQIDVPTKRVTTGCQVDMRFNMTSSHLTIGETKSEQIQAH